MACLELVEWWICGGLPAEVKGSRNVENLGEQAARAGSVPAGCGSGVCATDPAVVLGNTPRQVDFSAVLNELNGKVTVYFIVRQFEQIFKQEQRLRGERGI